MKKETIFDHPCKNTCSGWSQGYDEGRQVNRIRLGVLEKCLIEVERVASSENLESVQKILQSFDWKYYEEADPSEN